MKLKLINLKVHQCRSENISLSTYKDREYAGGFAL